MPAVLRLLPVSLAVLVGGLSWLILDHYPPWLAFYNDYAAFLALLLLLVYLALPAAPGKTAFKLPAAALAIFGIAAIPVIQTLTGAVWFAGDGWLAAIYLLGLAGAYAAGFNCAWRDKTAFANGLAWLFLACALLSTAAGLCQWQGIHLPSLVLNLPRGWAPNGNVGMANNFATMLCLGLASLIYLSLTARLNAGAAFAIALILVFGVAMSQSRTPWLGATFLLGWWILKRHTVPGLPGRALLLLVAYYALLVIFWQQIGVEATDVKLPAQKTAELGEREDIWIQYFDAALRSPWRGYGWNQVNLAKMVAAGIYPQTPLESHSHNLLLDLLIWNGFLLGCAVILGLAVWFGTRLKHCASPESWFALLGLAFIGVQSLVEFPYEFAYLLIPAGLLAGLVDADLKVSARVSVPKTVLWAALTVTAVLMTSIWREYRIVEEDYRQMRFEIARIGSKAPQPTPNVILLTQLREDLRMARTVARPNMSAEELEWMRKITHRYPYYSNLFRYGLSLALNGRREEAQLEFRRLRSLFGEKPYQQARVNFQLLAERRYGGLETNLELPP